MVRSACIQYRTPAQTPLGEVHFPVCRKDPATSVFTVPELKTATKSFSREVMLGDGGFGCVYKGLIKSVDDPSTRIEVAVK
ncbi:hypothetical protein VNO80_01748 [Phaseolus coccineus]|uniref:Protein kinase domain-containing protein n=1 Tax=Phaseolus coccineus TaxID=3886 RepID=A0AAN9WXB8_PHACN